MLVTENPLENPFVYRRKHHPQAPKIKIKAAVGQ